MTITYHIGGFLPDKPAQNKASEADPVGRTFTRWDADGNVLESRPLTADELEMLAPPPTTDSEKLTAARDALAVLDVIEAPVTAADLADVLVDVKTALGG